MEGRENGSADAAAGPQGSVLPYALIGAGPAGLAAARNLSRRGIPFVGFERHTEVGGLWDIDSPTSTMYESAHLISSKTTTAFDEFPMRDEVAHYPSHWEMRTYFNDYADTFDLRRHYRFGTTVVEGRNRPVAEAGTPAETWRITVEDGTGEQSTDTYRGLIIANGILAEPGIPEFEGEFEGELMHTSVYKRPDIFRTNAS